MNKYIIKEEGKPDKIDEAQIWWDAWHIADPGASNPVAIASTLAAASGALLHEIGTDAVRRHPALRVMAGQLSYLYDVDNLGPSGEDLDEVQKEFRRQEAIRATDVGPFCMAWGDNPCRSRPLDEIAPFDHAGRPKTVNRDYSIYGGSDV